MANENRHSTQQTSGGQLASVMSDEVVEQLFDGTDLRSLMQFHDVDGFTGSDTVDITQLPAPAATAAASSEISGGQSNSAFTTARFQLVWARRVLQYQSTDLLAINGGPVQQAAVISRLLWSVTLTLTDMLTALFPALANDVGPGTGVDLDVDSMYAAQYQLNGQNVPGPFAAVLHNEQFNNFQSSLRGETGAKAFQDPATSDMLRAMGPGWKGSWNNVNFWQSDSVTAVASSADRSGAMFGFGCFGYTLRDWRRIVGEGMLDSNDVRDDFGPGGFVERVRDGTNGMTALILNTYPAVVAQEDLRGVEIISDL